MHVLTDVTLVTCGSSSCAIHSYEDNNSVALVHKKELVEKFTGWKNEESSTSENLILHDVNKPKSINRVTEKYATEISTASIMEVEEASTKKSQTSKSDEDASSDLESELDAWSAKRLALIEKKQNATPSGPHKIPVLTYKRWSTENYQEITKKCT